ncbi:MAG: sugar ABC transporter substrate-binding protein [Halobacteriaceae archaeon]
MAPTLRVLVRPFEGFERALDRQIDAFTEDRDVAVEVDHRPLPEIHADLIEDEGLADADYDVFICLSDWLPDVADRGLIEPLDDRLAADPPADYPEGWAESMRSLLCYDGHTYGLPYHDGPELFHYRTDLFESVAEQRRFREEYGRPLHPPKTWAEFREVAEFFTRPEEDLWGTVVAALPDGHNDVYDFLIQLWSRGGDVFDDEMNPTFHDETGVEALQFYHDLIHEDEVAPPESVEMESVEAGQFYAEGKAAMMWNWAGFGALAEDLDSAVFGHTGYGLIPRADGPDGRHTSLTVNYGTTIPASAPNPDLAYEFIRHLGSPEMDKVTTTAGGSGTRLSTWRDPDVVADQSFYPMVEEINTGPVNTMPKIPQFTAFNDVLNEAVERVVVEQSATPAEALADAAREVESLLDGP